MNSSTTSFRRYLVVILLAAVLIGASMVTLTEALVRFGVERNHNIFQHAAFVTRTSASCAAFGDSHTALGFAGSKICVNFGYPGETFADTVRKFDVLGEARTPHRIILQVDPLLFSRTRLEAGQSIHINYIQGADGSSLRILDPLHFPLLIRYWRTAILKQGFTPVFDFRKTGWLAYDARWENISPQERITRAQREAAGQTPVGGFQSHPTAQQLREFLIRQVSAGREVCLVTYPMSAEFIESAATTPNFSEAIDFFSTLAAAVGVTYVNMLNWRGSDITMFANADHLNTTGGEAFTGDLLERCGF